ncbi:hypothetical protein PHLCEN_2v6940 [Hermanssonia centrifuga]|uniref:Uncharacterized protein n=1 Tax=Hermanssonia centrifuga TaxID=98765 RepID=A0A2R6NXZ8_9APHY|nr:hypothetical protein PHLCEN_2v6940 [Hermanssonia centrifuga]
MKAGMCVHPRDMCLGIGADFRMGTQSWNAWDVTPSHWDSIIQTLWKLPPQVKPRRDLKRAAPYTVTKSLSPQIGSSSSKTDDLPIPAPTIDPFLCKTHTTQKGFLYRNVPRYRGVRPK